MSAQLSELAGRQRTLITTEHPAAHLVYTGGDDLLAFCPARGALELAAALRAQVREACASGPLATAGMGGSAMTASTGVAFVYMSNPLQEGIGAARDAIHRAKSVTDRAGRSRDALCVVVRRRGGQRAVSVQPWWLSPTRGSAAELLAAARPGPAGTELSAGLAGVLERDREELDTLAGDRALLAAEIERLVLRQGGSLAVASALVALGHAERTGSSAAAFRPAPAAPAALVARFLSQEAG